MLVLTSKKKRDFKAILFIACTWVMQGHAEIRIQGDLGESIFSEPPKRVAALSWELAENVIELGVSPIAVPEITLYKEWVSKPSIPATSQDIGSRAEPNFEKLAQLKPDVILITTTLKDIKPKLEKIAPVIFFDTYRADHNNATKADEVFLSIATLLDRKAQAEVKLQQRESTYQRLKNQLNKAFPDGLPKVTTMRFANTTSAYLYVDNSMPQYALEAIGIENAISLKSSQWGIIQKRLKFLRSINQGTVLYFQPFYQEDKLNRSPLWQAMPFVQQGKVASIESTWTYGGAMSLQYLAESITEALLKVTRTQ
ncbi:iron-siderophore ABC transporter substrate-binding protein [Marinomonas transparens]|uniref:Iron-siderophore ABC transporter substrate-binding protein n=1 Tax=Marinomonas transparens TaxID=2795388 RepID=A0A934JSP5_9GAMM|nr:iron-siderophore ABC transporter substrate-binding protein [Marinomonas transparens]MBJ7536367.1 iron-siderophore ABC transporter substrate-binding protein [Marinomonas transparens]